MSGPDNSTMDDEADDVARLLRASGGRREPSAAMRARLHASALTAFEALPEVDQPSLRQGARAASGRWYRFPVKQQAIAALLVLTVGATLLWHMQRGETVQPVVAEVNFSRGAWYLDDHDARAATAHSMLHAAARIRTAHDSQLSLRLSTGVTLRLPGDTQLILARADRIELQQGRVYVDAAGPTAAIQVVTAHGTVTDLGTQFEVQIAPTAITVLVRDGRVVLEADHTRLTATATAGIGESLRLDVNGNILRRALRADDPYWQWLGDAPTPYVLERGNLHDFLAWSAARARLTLRYQSEAVRAAAVATHTRGDIDGMSTTTAIESVLATTHLRRKRAAADELLIEFADRD